VNAADTFGCTGMHYAVGNKNMEMVTLLIENRFNLKLEDNQGITPLIAAEKTENIHIRNYIKAALFEQSRQT
jgi:ankyrin repeat protein